MLIEDIAGELHDADVGIYDPIGTTGDIFVSSLPATPDNCLALYDTGGQVDAVLKQDFIRTVQVIVRDVSYVSANQRAWQAYWVLASLSRRGDRRFLVRPVDVPRSIGSDTNGRHEFTINTEMWTAGD